MKYSFAREAQTPDLRQLEHYCAEIGELLPAIMQAAQSSYYRVSPSGIERAVHRLTNLAAQFNTSAAYDAMQNRIATTLEDTLSSRYDLAELASEWRYMDLQEKGEVAQAILTTMCQIQTRESHVTVRPPQMKAISVPGNRNGSVICGALTGDYRDNPHANALLLNMHPDSRLGSDFGHFLNTLTHENTHNLQKHLARAVATGEVHRQDPLFYDGAMFKMIADYDAYIPSALPQAYRTQILEADAFGFGDRMEAFAHDHARPARNAYPGFFAGGNRPDGFTVIPIRAL